MNLRAFFLCLLLCHGNLLCAHTLDESAPAPVSQRILTPPSEDKTASETGTLSFEKLLDQQGQKTILIRPQRFLRRLTPGAQLDLCRFLLRQHVSQEALLILRTLAEQHRTDAMALLAELTGTGATGVAINLRETSQILTELETMAAAEGQSGASAESLCRLYQNPDYHGSNAAKTLTYCLPLYQQRRNLAAEYARQLLEESSPLYEPELGMKIYQECLDQDNACQISFSWQALYTPMMASTLAQHRLLSYLSSGLNTASPIVKTRLAHFYLTGLGTPRDTATALRLLESAAKTLEPAALYQLISLRFFMAVPQDASAALASHLIDARQQIAEYRYQVAESEHFKVTPFADWLDSRQRLPANTSEFESFLREEANRGKTLDACLLSEHWIQSGDLASAIPAANQCHTSRVGPVHDWADRLLGEIRVRQTVAP